MKKIYLAGGCFWGVEAYFQQLYGVLSTKVGYANGDKANPSYEEVKNHLTTHAETVEIIYDEKILFIEDILTHFLRFVDPYSIDQQGHDYGHQYRSGVYYLEKDDYCRIKNFFDYHLRDNYQIEIKELENFYLAEEYHQDYLLKNPNGYCHVNLNLIRKGEKKMDKIGNTPLVELTKLEKELGLKGHIFAKLEGKNFAGSVKDRIAYQIINDAEEDGRLHQGSVIIEATSGNTGIGLAAVAKLKGYRSIIVMPESMSQERRDMITNYGGELILSPKSEGMKGAVEIVKKLAEENKDYFIADQFNNPSNPKAHYLTTGPEIYKQLDGKVDVFVSAFGTGGTVSGAGRFLKEQNPNIKVVAVEPEDSPLLTKGYAGPHKIQGIGANFIPNTLDRSVIDAVELANSDEAFKYGKLVREIEGIDVGISSGAALSIAIKLAKEEKNIVVIFPDGGDRYYSTDLYK